MFARSSEKRSSRWLLPREHGAYAEVILPLVTVFFLGKPTLASCGLSLAILAGFLAHEPRQILLGARGGALQRELRGRARAQGALLLTASSAAAAFGLCRADALVVVAAAGLLPALALLLGLTLAGRSKSLLGETLVALVLAFAAVPVALAAGLSPPAALRSALAWSAVFGLGTATVHALLARKKRGVFAPSFAVMGMGMGVISGAVFWWTGGAPRGALPDNFREIGRLGIQDFPVLEQLPWSVVILLVIGIGAILLMRASFGRRLMAVGDNESAARLSGVKVENMRTIAFVLSGLSAAVAGILLGGFAGVSAQGGQGLEFQAITAVVLGGVVLGGGRGTVLAAMAGALTLEALFTLLNLYGVSGALEDTVQGIIIIAAVAFASYRLRGAR